MAVRWCSFGFVLLVMFACYPQGPQLQTPQRPEPQWPQLLTPQRPEPQWPAVTKTPDQRCQVQVQDTVQCGTPDITPSQCQAIDCCFNGQQCFYGKAVTVQCTRDVQFVVVVAMDATWPNIDVDSISLLGGNDSPCSPVGITSAFAIYQFPVTACGTTLKEESGYVVYENRMVSSYNVRMGPRGSITRDSHFELLFQCKYSATAVEALVIEVNTVPAPAPVAALGPLRVNSDWLKEHATPRDSRSFTLKDPTCLIYYLLFTNLFYAILSCQIFIHCSTSVCYPTPGVSCEPKCNRQRR
uniref:Zona pellucida sperm-binding protein 4 n=1 Tax=Hucho hucho TaxID=62062 RepID=A0A4W5RU46_9TELE